MKHFSHHKDTPKHVTTLAQQFRKNLTPQEAKFWKKLSAKQFMGLKFRRQHPINRYIADFYNHNHRLVIEVDGQIHNDTINYDKNRDAFFQALGIKVVRVSNNEIETNLEKVLYELQMIIEGSTPCGGGEYNEPGA